MRPKEDSQTNEYISHQCLSHPIWDFHAALAQERPISAMDDAKIDRRSNN